MITRLSQIPPTLLLLAVLTPGVQASEELFAAARAGDAAALKEQLDKGADVNAKWRYDQTALLIAASRGHVDAVKLLLDRGAAVNIKDSFYGVSPLGAAMGFGAPVDEKKSAAIGRMLIEKGAPDRDQFLTNAARSGKKEVVRSVLPLQGWKPETLTLALRVAAANKHQEIEEMLKASGATLPPEVKIDPEVMARYAGVYSATDGMELKIDLTEGKLRGTFGGQAMILRPLDQTTFEPEQYPGSQKIAFTTAGDAVTGVEVQSPQRTIKFTRASAK